MVIEAITGNHLILGVAVERRILIALVSEAPTPSRKPSQAFLSIVAVELDLLAYQRGEQRMTVAISVRLPANVPTELVQHIKP